VENRLTEFWEQDSPVYARTFSRLHYYNPKSDRQTREHGLLFEDIDLDILEQQRLAEEERAEGFSSARLDSIEKRQEDVENGLMKAVRLPILSNFIVDITADICDSVSRSCPGMAIRLNPGIKREQEADNPKVLRYTAAQSRRLHNLSGSVKRLRWDPNVIHPVDHEDFDVRIRISELLDDDEVVASRPEGRQFVPHVQIVVYLDLYERQRSGWGWFPGSRLLARLPKAGFDVVFETLDRSRRGGKKKETYVRYAERFKIVAQTLLESMNLSMFGYTMDDPQRRPTVTFGIHQNLPFDILRRRRTENERSMNFDLATIGYTYSMPFMADKRMRSLIPLHKRLGLVESISWTPCSVYAKQAYNVYFNNYKEKFGPTTEDLLDLMPSSKAVEFSDTMFRPELIRAVYDPVFRLFQVNADLGFKVSKSSFMADREVSSHHPEKVGSAALKIVYDTCARLLSTCRILTGRYPLVPPEVIIPGSGTKVHDASSRVSFTKLFPNSNDQMEKEWGIYASYPRIIDMTDSFPLAMITTRMDDIFVPYFGRMFERAGPEHILGYMVNKFSIGFIRNSKGAKVVAYGRFVKDVPISTTSISSEYRRVVPVAGALLSPAPGIVVPSLRMRTLRKFESIEEYVSKMREFKALSDSRNLLGYNDDDIAEAIDRADFRMLGLDVASLDEVTGKYEILDAPFLGGIPGIRKFAGARVISK
jgi:hypothetical protein